MDVELRSTNQEYDTGALGMPGNRSPPPLHRLYRGSDLEDADDELSETYNDEPHKIWTVEVYDARPNPRRSRAQEPQAIYHDTAPFDFSQGSKLKNISLKSTLKGSDGDQDEERWSPSWSGRIFQIFCRAYAHFPTRPTTTKEASEDDSSSHGFPVPVTSAFESLDFESKSTESIVVVSPFLYCRLKTIAGYYPSFFDQYSDDLQDLKATSAASVQKSLVIRSPWAFLMHKFPQLEAFIEDNSADSGKDGKPNETNEEVLRLEVEHTRHLYNFLKPFYESTVRNCIHRLSQAPAQVAFEMLWYVFPPGTDVYVGNGDECRAMVVSRVRSNLDDSDSSISQSEVNHWDLELWYLDTDGITIGQVGAASRLYRYIGLAHLTTLDVCPTAVWDAHDGGNRRRQFLKRSQVLFRALSKGHLLADYDGPASKGHYKGPIIIDIPRALAFKRAPGPTLTYYERTPHSDHFKAYGHMLVRETTPADNWYSNHDEDEDQYSRFAANPFAPYSLPGPQQPAWGSGNSKGADKPVSSTSRRAAQVSFAESSTDESIAGPSRVRRPLRRNLASVKSYGQTAWQQPYTVPSPYYPDPYVPHTPYSSYNPYFHPYVPPGSYPTMPTYPPPPQYDHYGYFNGPSWPQSSSYGASRTSERPRPLTESLTDHQLLLLAPQSWGFALKSKQWLTIYTHYAVEATQSDASIENLVLDEGELNTIKALSTRQYSERDTWAADFIEGKGTGQVILLHGPPGVGKTYTVEAIAQYLGRPLLSLTVADIGTAETRVEKELLKWFSLAESWKAVLLVDEADIFLERRQNKDLARNGLVSAFLRRMEYFKGLLFLTTNRVGQIDDAFISRVHISIGYGTLTPESRSKIWQGFFRKLAKERAGRIQISPAAKKWVLEAAHDGQAQLNGRDIRNALQTAITLAEVESQEDPDFDPESMTVIVDQSHFKKVLDISNKFQVYVQSIRREDERKRAAARYDRNDYWNESKDD